MSYPHKLPTILVLAASIIVFLSSLLCLAFKMSAYTSYIDQGSWGTSMLALKSSSYNVNGWIAIYPEHLMSVTRAPLVLTASLGLVTGLAVTWLATRHLITKRVLLLVNSQQIAFIAGLAANALLALITMIYTLVQHVSSAHFDPGYVMTKMYYDNGLFSLEAWTCETPYYVPEFLFYEFRTQCVGEWASRGLVIILCFFSLAVLGLLVRDLNTTQTLIAKKKSSNNSEDEDSDW